MKAALSFVRGEGGINRPLFTSRVANQDAREREGNVNRPGEGGGARKKRGEQK